MEKVKEKKRKRVTETGEVDGGSGRMKKEKEVEREKAEAAPSEEEVEEFFEILRRMQVAVKYFEKSSNGDGNSNDKANGDGRRLTDLLGTKVNDVKANEKGLNRRLVNGVLDLNAVPAESNSV